MLCAVVVLTGVALWWSAAWWIPLWLPVVAEKYGVSVEALEIDAVGNWQAESIRYTDSGWLIVAEGVRMSSPLRWIWSAWREIPQQAGRLDIDQLFIEQGEGAVAGERDSADFDLSPTVLWQQLESLHVLVERWLPPIQLGEWTFKGLAPVPEVSGSGWSYEDQHLQGQVRSAELAPEMVASVHIVRLPEATWEFTLQLKGDYAGWGQPLDAVVFDTSVYLRESGLLLRELEGSAHWFDARLSHPVQVDFRGPTIKEDARLELAVDLSGQSVLPLGGRFEGWLDFSAGVLDLTGRGSLGFGGQLSQFVYKEFPELTADIHIDGNWDGAGVALQSLDVAASHAEWGDLEWQGEGNWQLAGNDAAARGELTLRHELATLKSRLSVDFAGSVISGTIESARLEAVDFPKMELVEAFSLRLPRTEDGTWDWRLLELDPLFIAANEAETHVRIEWQPEQDLFVSIQQLPIYLLSPWLEIPEPLRELQVETFRLKDFNWHNGLSGSGELAVSIASVEWQQSKIATRAKLAVEFSADGLRVDTIEWTAGGETLASGALHLPLQFLLPTESSTEWLKLTEPAKWEGALELHMPSLVAEWLAESTGVTLGESTIAFNVEGEGEEVVMRLDVAIDKMRMPAREGIDESALIAERVALSLRADRNAIIVEQAIVDWGGGRLAASAELPVAALLASGYEGAIERLRTGEWLDELTADVDLKDFSVAFWRNLLPPIVRPDGRLEGHFSMRPGRVFSGELIASDFALRPTLTAQAVEAIQARLLLDGTRIIVQDAGARIGGSAAKLEGYIDFTERDRLEWLVHLSGKNVPLVRTVDMLVRADVDLRFQNNASSEFQPLLVGRVDLKSSSLWIQFDPLAPRPAGRVRGPEPPFFQLEQEFLQHWRLDIQLSGNRFLRVRNPWFAAEMSASFLLSGTLGEPLLTGALILESGVLRMPAMNMRFDRGEIFITPDESNEIQLELSATGQRANHVITVDARGTVRNPQLQFRAIPDLTQGQILRILTTGGLEGAGAGNLGLYLGRGFVGSAGADGGFADRLQLDYGRSVSNTGRNTLDAEWMLTERFFLRGQYDEYDAYNLDILWRILRR
jgi:hypothetical protein